MMGKKERRIAPLPRDVSLEDLVPNDHFHRRLEDALEEAIAPSEEGFAGPDDHRQLLLNRIKSLSPAGFERLCQRLLRESGFQHVEVTGRSSDGGIDGVGILRVNPPMSFRVPFQRKRYGNAIVPSRMRDFRGAKRDAWTRASLSRRAPSLSRRDERPTATAFRPSN